LSKLKKNQLHNLGEPQYTIKEGASSAFAD